MMPQDQPLQFTFDMQDMQPVPPPVSGTHLQYRSGISQLQFTCQPPAPMMPQQQQPLQLTFYMHDMLPVPPVSGTHLEYKIRNLTLSMVSLLL